MFLKLGDARHDAGYAVLCHEGADCVCYTTKIIPITWRMLIGRHSKPGGYRFLAAKGPNGVNEIRAPGLGKRRFGGDLAWLPVLQAERGQFLGQVIPYLPITRRFTGTCGGWGG